MEAARRFAPLLLLCAYGCSAEPQLEFADWLLDVPNGTPVVEHKHVPRDARGLNSIVLVEDMIFGADLGNPQAALFEPLHIVASPNGNVFVADGAENSIRMYSPSGGLLGNLGRAGQGPGEFGWIWSLAVAGDQLVVDDRRNQRLSVWSLDGEHIADYSKSSRAVHFSTQGMENGTLLSRYEDQTMDGGTLAVAFRTQEDRELSRIIEFDVGPMVIPGDDWDTHDIMRAMMRLYQLPTVTHAAHPSGRVYVSPVRQYQVLSLATDGEAQWALRTNMSRPAFPEAVKEFELDRARQQSETRISADDVDWPEGYDSIEHLRTDGAGRLYVFLEHGLPFPETPDLWEVDVYSPQGERLAAGFLPEVWSYAQGDYVYGIRTDPETEERVAVRYRLILSEQ